VAIKAAGLENRGAESTATEAERTSLVTPPPTRKRKRNRKAKKSFLARPGQLAAAAGLGVVLIVVIVGIVVLTAGGALDASLRGRTDKTGENQGAAPVVFDAVLPAEKVPAAAVPPPAIVPAPPAGPAVPPPALLPPADEVDAPPPKAAWNIPADPRPDPLPRYAADMRVRLETARIAHHFLLKYLPLLADLDGPFALCFPPLPAKPPARLGPPAPADGAPPAPLVDLRTGKAAGTFAATSPYWRDARLSPDGQYLVGPDSGPDSLGRPLRDTLFVWKRGADNFAHMLRLPGSVVWLGFVASDRLAVQTFDPKPALQVWDVTTGKVSKTVRLTADQFPAPAGNPALQARDLAEFYRPYFTAGAVSPGGRYVALGNRAGITLVDVREGKEVGTLPIPGLGGRQADAFRGLSFRPDGAELLALTYDDRALALKLWSWSVADGRPRTEMALDWASSGCGPPLPGPTPGTILLPGGHFGPGLPPFGHIPPFRATDVRTATLVETRCGSIVARLDYCVLRWTDDGPVLAAGGPKEAKPEKLQRADERWDKGIPQEAFTVTPDRPRLIAAARERLAGLAARPPVVRPDRTAVKRLTPEPPSRWAAPPTVRQAELLKVRWLEADFPAAFGDAQAAVLRFEYKIDVRQRFEMHWDRYDLRNAAKVGTGFQLWPWARDPSRMKQHESVFQPQTPPAALGADGARLAVCDPADLSRVDVWSADGKRLVGFRPAGPGRAVGWVGWSPQGRLLTVADGSLVAWEVPAARAVIEVAGGYAAPVALAPGGAWLAVAAGDHVDLLDSATGACLGRCRAGGALGAVRDLALSGDARRLAVVFAGPDPKAGTLKAQLWDLAAGRAELLTFGRGPYVTASWASPEHLVTVTDEQVLYDQLARYGIATYQFITADRKWHGSFWARSPDGRLWFRLAHPRPVGARSTGVWWQVTEAELLGSLAGRLAERPRAAVFPRLHPVRVEADLGTAERGQAFARPVAEMLRKQGFAIGPKGWSLRVTHQVVNSTKELTRQIIIEVPQLIPMVRLKWVLCDAEGNPVWQRDTAGQFAWTGSKYYKGSSRLPPKGRAGMEWVKTHFDFGGRPMREAIADEILDTLARRPTPLDPIPPAWLRVGRDYREMPLRLLPVVAGPAAPGPGQAGLPR
jgi:hypothetical protein